MALYFPKNPSVLKRYETFYSSSRVQQYDFLSVRDLLIEQKLFRTNRVQGCAEDNAFAAFMGLPLKRHDIVQSLEKIDYKLFEQHFNTVINTNSRSIISSIE